MCLVVNIIFSSEGGGDAVALSRLAYWRLLRGLKQYELAAKVGIHPALLSLWETGRRRIPEHVLQRLAEVLQVAPEELQGVIEDAAARR